MKMPTRILDLHTHLFNARYIPLASIIANAMGKDESKLADRVAKLLERLTGSSYQEPEQDRELRFLHQEAPDTYYLEKLWAVTEHELLQSARSFTGLRFGVSSISDRPIDDPTMSGLLESDLMVIITELSEIDYAKEGWADDLPADAPHVVSRAGFDSSWLIGDVFNWAKGVVKKALRVVTKLMDPIAWGKAENYLEFFLTMLNSEEKMAEKVFRSYKSDLPPLQISHYLMDMQMAYEKQKAPYYAFHPTQLDRMQTLQRANPGRVYGFSAFDPRRPSWRQHAGDSLAKGFLGFKFYPAMGYKPSGNEDQKLQDAVDAFFDFCIERDVPIFAHCTPQGFQTRHKLGRNAHPKYWRDVLSNMRWNKLRLCLGHAGGGNMQNGPLTSAGWMANSDGQWGHQDNFAHIVAELCVTYPNVYCEMGYITELLEDDDKREIFVSNIERARKLSGNFDFLEKIAYGSDWHMPDMVDNTREYLGVFLNILNRTPYLSYLDKFFWKNAYQFLRLPT